MSKVNILVYYAGVSIAIETTKFQLLRYTQLEKMYIQACRHDASNYGINPELFFLEQSELSVIKKIESTCLKLVGMFVKKYGIKAFEAIGGGDFRFLSQNVTAQGVEDCVITQEFLNTANKYMWERLEALPFPEDTER